jgi:hypothetical protein
MVFLTLFCLSLCVCLYVCEYVGACGCEHAREKEANIHTTFPMSANVSKVSMSVTMGSLLSMWAGANVFKGIGVC